MVNKEKFWFEDPKELINNFCKFSPFGPFTKDRLGANLNAYTRLIIILIIVLYALLKEVYYVFIGLFLIVIIIVVYYIMKKDYFVNTEHFRPLPDDFPFLNEGIYSNPINNSKELLREAQLPERKSDYFDSQVYEFIKNNPLKNIPIPDYSNEPKYSKSTLSTSEMSKYADGKMFQTSDQWIFDRNTQPFYTTPNTSIPNDQTTFANWLYGTENVCKEGAIYMHRTGTPVQAQSCNGFNVATPTNFGNLNDYSLPY